MSIETLAGALCVGVKRIYQMEQQGVDRVSTAEAWARALKMNPEVLIFGTANAKKAK